MTKWTVSIFCGCGGADGTTKVQAVKPMWLDCDGRNNRPCAPGFTPDTRITGHELLESIPQLGEYARIEVEEFSKIASGDFTTAMMVSLANRVNEIFTKEPAVSAVVVSIGSNTLEEVAYFLDLTVKSDKPVILTAAQRLHGTLGADGDMNLLDAIRVAVDPQTRGMGVLAVVNDEINAARDVRKNISHRVDAWNSGDLGDLGLVDKDRVIYYRKTIRKHTTQSEFDVSGMTDLPPVYISVYICGADRPGGCCREEGHAKGIVMAGFPTGAGSPEQANALLKVADHGHSRGGQPARRPGTSREPLSGVYRRRQFHPQQARLLLMLALLVPSDKKIIEKMFQAY